MGFDPIVVNAGRLRILTALATAEAEEFVHLRNRTNLTDGNLATHARRLQNAGLISISKILRDGKITTLLRLNRAGRAALENHAREVMAAIVTGPDSVSRESEIKSVSLSHDEDWVD
jgi:DNA-binding MarR family transcriptional regulator